MKVRKGSAAPSDESRAVFRADKLTSERILWNEAHLLEIQYDIAEIERFRNFWGLYEVQNVGSLGERNYEVEVRLVPLTSDFSLLTPDGHFRQIAPTAH